MIPAKEIDGELWIRAADAHIKKEAEQRDLRDYFAAKALNVAIQQTKYYCGIDQKTVAGWCYEMADAMLKERSK